MKAQVSWCVHGRGWNCLRTEIKCSSEQKSYGALLLEGSRRRVRIVFLERKGLLGLSLVYQP